MTTTNAPARPIRLHRHRLSGHAHRVELLLSILGLPFEPIDVAFERREQKSPAFLALNRFGQVPVIEDGDVVLADSNAILVYLAGRYDASGAWHPRDPVGAARVQVWLSVAAGPLAASAGAARRSAIFNAGALDDKAIAAAGQLLVTVDGALAERPFLAANHPTIADLAIYSYTAHAPEGGVSLEPHRHVQAWLARIEALPGFVPMARTPLERARHA